MPSPNIAGNRRAKKSSTLTDYTIYYRIFLLLDEVGQVPKENVVVQFKAQSFDVKIRGYKG
jgi:hypothetical protein